MIVVTCLNHLLQGVLETSLVGSNQLLGLAKEMSCLADKFLGVEVALLGLGEDDLAKQFPKSTKEQRIALIAACRVAVENAKTNSLVNATRLAQITATPPKDRYKLIWGDGSPSDAATYQLAEAQRRIQNAKTLGLIAEMGRQLNSLTGGESKVDAPKSTIAAEAQHAAGDTWG